MSAITGLQCAICGQRYAVDAFEYVCPRHGDDGNLDVLYDYAGIARIWNATSKPSGRQGMWRYLPLLPLEPGARVPPLLVGDTPLYPAPALAQAANVREVWIKDDGRNPTGSLKDRASALVVARALAEGRGIVTTASTGNAGAALAGMAASVALPTVIFAPASAPEAKVAQLLVYGAQVLLVDGTYDDAFDLCLQASREFGWYCRNTGYNPYTAEGKKTVVYEICEQLSGRPGRFRAPDAILVSVGDGNIISGVYKGVRDLLALGWIDRLPRLIGVQADGSAALYHAWREELDPMQITRIQPNTVADSIAAGLPRDRVKAIKAVQESHGMFVAVSDAEILAAIPRLARATGVFAEPAAAAAFAGFLQMTGAGAFDPDAVVVILSTGSGLKDIAAARQSVPQARIITPDLRAVEQVIGEAF